MASNSRWPKTACELAHDGYTGDNWAACRYCGQKILWAFTPKGKKMPMEEVAGGDGIARYQAHFTTCEKQPKRE